MESNKVSSCCGTDWELSVACSPIKPNQRIKICLNCGKSCQLVDKPAELAPINIERLEKCIAEPETTLTLIAQVRLVKEGMLEYICSCGDTFKYWAEFGLHREMIHGDINIGKLKHPGRRYHAAKLLARIAELEAKLARSVELTQDEAEILITSFENESMRRYGKVAKDIPLIPKLKARPERMVENG